jgi:hypothetical protein
MKNRYAQTALPWTGLHPAVPGNGSMLKIVCEVLSHAPRCRNRLILSLLQQTRHAIPHPWMGAESISKTRYVRLDEGTRLYSWLAICTSAVEIRRKLK